MIKKVLTIIIFSTLIQYSLSAEIVKIFEFTEDELSTLEELENSINLLLTQSENQS